MKKDNSAQDESIILSIIIPIYNAEKFIKACLESIVIQNKDNMEIILVNDGSTDSSLKICEEIKENIDNIVLVNQDNLGVSAARNTALKMARGKLVYFCDSDDLVAPKAIDFIIDMWIKHKYELLCFQYIRFDEKRPVIKQVNIKDDCCKISREKALIQIHEDVDVSGFLWNKCFNTEVIRKNNILFAEDIKILEDEIFVLKYISCCKEIIISKNILYFYRRDISSTLLQKNKEKKLQAAKGRIGIYETIINNEMLDNNVIRKNAWNYMMDAIIAAYGDTLLSRLKNKKVWKKYLESKFCCYYFDYKHMFRLNKREILYRILQMCTLKNRKKEGKNV